MLKIIIPILFLSCSALADLKSAAAVIDQELKENEASEGRCILNFKLRPTLKELRKQTNQETIQDVGVEARFMVDGRIRDRVLFTRQFLRKDLEKFAEEWSKLSSSLAVQYQKRNCQEISRENYLNPDAKPKGHTK